VGLNSFVHIHEHYLCGLSPFPVSDSLSISSLTCAEITFPMCTQELVSASYTRGTQIKKVGARNNHRKQPLRAKF
jgi:hypothetical protein